MAVQAELAGLLNDRFPDLSVSKPAGTRHPVRQPGDHALFRALMNPLCQIFRDIGGIKSQGIGLQIQRFRDIRHHLPGCLKIPHIQRNDIEPDRVSGRFLQHNGKPHRSAHPTCAVGRQFLEGIVCQPAGERDGVNIAAIPAGLPFLPQAGDKRPEERRSGSVLPEKGIELRISARGFRRSIAKNKGRKDCSMKS